MVKELIDKVVEGGSVSIMLDSIIEDATLVQKDRDKKKPVDAKKSKAAKDRWRKHRLSYERGIEDFNRSPEGKRFHKKLGRYNSRKSNNAI